MQLINFKRKSIFIFTLFILGFVKYSNGQTLDISTYKPYIITTNARVATTNEYELQKINVGISSVQFLDGNGAGLQTVGFATSPQKKDMISGVTSVDALGRTIKGYLPIFNNSFSNGQFKSSVNLETQAYYNDPKPFSVTETFDTSPSSQVLKAVGPGIAFQGAVSKGSTSDYMTAGAGIRKYVIENDGSINGTGQYQNGDLIKTISTDEDGNIMIDYKGGRSGRLIQKQQINRVINETLTTAFVYDFGGRLIYTIPPKAFVAQVSYPANSPLITQGLYQNKYDGQSRIILSTKPGGDFEEHIYNELNQILFTQNARQREEIINGYTVWEWVKYDGHGRLIMSGTKSLNLTPNAIRNYFKNYTETEQFEERTTAANNIFGYTNRSFPPELLISETDVKIVNYFDDYAWVNDPQLNFQQYKSPVWPNVKGVATGGLVRNLGNQVMLKSVSYYDDKNRLIQTQNKNRYGLVNQVDMVYNFAGDLLEKKSVYRKPNTEPLNLATTYNYDHVGRKIGAVHFLNGKATPLAKNTYDEIGRLAKTELMKSGFEAIIEETPQPNGNNDIADRFVLLKPGTISAENGTYLAEISKSALQEINYSYNIRGALRGINLGADGEINLTNGDVFGLKLDFHETAQTFNGKINKQTWQTNSASSNNAPRSFTYGYDGYDRLSSSVYAGQGAENYSVSNTNFDNNGNITSLIRNGFISPNNWGQIDNLSYNYGVTNNSNELLKIDDTQNSTLGFTDTNNATDYTYYADGSLKTDQNKGITLIEYNYMGLPTKIHFGANKRIENTYDALGVKMQQKYIISTETIITDYIGELIYKDDTLKTIFTDQGRVKVDNGSLLTIHYQFFISDHLGNNRIIIERLNNVTALVQETHYGPWGEVLEGLGQSGDWRFLYQAKEYIDGLGYDFHSRTYDPYSGRFLQLDGANQFASGYTGMGNVPTMGVDPDGQWVQQAIGAVLGAYSGYQIGKMNGATGWKMAGYIAGGAAIGAISGGLSNSISAGGGFLANTNAIVVGSMANSFGMDALSGGKTPFVISFGAASYNATEGEWGYLGKEGNSKMENFGYAMGAMANVQDLVAGFNGVKVDVTARKEIAGHSEINGCYGDQCIAISVGPLDEIQLPDGTSQMRWEKQYGKMTLRGKSARGKNVNFIENGDPVFTKTLNNVNGSILTKMTDRLMRGQNLIGNSNLKYGFMYGCVNYTSRALFGAGVLNFNALLPLTSPVLLNAELALRNYGMLSSYFFTR